MESHLLQMRGLKPGDEVEVFIYHDVASFTDAWIETIGNNAVITNDKSHLLQMRGLKPFV